MYLSTFSYTYILMYIYLVNITFLFVWGDSPALFHSSPKENHQFNTINSAIFFLSRTAAAPLIPAHLLAHHNIYIYTYVYK